MEADTSSKELEEKKPHKINVSIASKKFFFPNKSMFYLTEFQV